MLKTRFDLIDAYTLLNNVAGARFTWRRIKDNKLTQSRLDRFYISNKSWWIDKVHHLRHIGDQILSDHDPIILTFNIERHNPNAPALLRSSYFKANPSILKKPEHIA